MPLPTAQEPFGSHCQKQVIRRRFDEEEEEDGGFGFGSDAEEVEAVGSRGGLEEEEEEKVDELGSDGELVEVVGS